METMLTRVMRPVVVFDVENPDHRKWYAIFLKSKSWGKCPVKFVTAGYGNTKGIIDRQMLEYYAEQELNSQEHTDSSDVLCKQLRHRDN